jgi:F-type H+-transporting ATPase subunit gamma
VVHQLTLEFNKARQEAVTRELIEIVTAIEAMKK